MLGSFNIRSRKETNTKETINLRHVEQWQTDPPYSDKTFVYEDTTALPSRLYRESLDRNAPYQITMDESRGKHLEKEGLALLAEIQALDSRIRIEIDPDAIQRLSAKLTVVKSNYEAILQAGKQAAVQSISSNPYFEKYDVGGDSRNIIRELRSVVHEDIGDRGVNESKKLLGRTFESRWVAKEETIGLNSLDAYELIRPAMNNMEKIYKS